MPCTDGKFRTYQGVTQKCIGGEWVDMPIPPPESAGLISIQREINTMDQLEDQGLEAAIKSPKKRVIMHIEDVSAEDG